MSASSFEVAQNIFRRAGEEQLHTKLESLLRTGAPWEEWEAAYSPLFQKLALEIIGRSDIPIPPAADYSLHFHVACNPSDQVVSNRWIEKIIEYIMAEDKKRPREVYAPAPEVLAAVQNAWKTNYVGNNQSLLREAMNDMYIKSSKKPYGNFCAIIQGSGTGKSRLVDELSRSVFAIPIILRPDEDTSGFPLGDIADGISLVNFFCGFKLKPALHVQRRYLLFLLKIIVFADQWIDEQKSQKVKPKELAALWKTHLGDPQSKVRIGMYTAAISEAPLKGELDVVLKEDVAFDVVQKRVRGFINSVSKKIKPTRTKLEPAILFYFDEAHHLTNTTVTIGVPERTAYQCLCKAFTYMTQAPVFALFLSTYSRLSELTPSARNFWSSRPKSSQSAESDDNLNAPFVELPFDTWKKPILVTEGSHSAEEICSLKFMARFGRPLFWTLLEQSQSADENSAMTYAMSKLQLHVENSTREKPRDYPLNELIPLLAARVDLTFESNRDEAVYLEGLLVASSMRTVYSVPQHRQYLRGGYPSEPFLGEAAARAIFKHCRSKVLGPVDTITRTDEDIEKIIATYKDEIPSAVSAWFIQGLIDKGNRGELVARMLCTLAHDISILKSPSFVGDVIDDSLSFSKMIPVVDFLSALIAEEYIEKVLNARPSNLSGKTLKEAFKNSFVHFTQFVKADDKSTITDEGVLLLFLRGAAIQGYWNMEKADLVIPIWSRRQAKDKPDRWSMSAIFLQVKNRVDEQFILINAQEIFEFFTTSVVKEHSTRPYITIAMELGVLRTEQRKASQPQASASQPMAGVMPTTPERKTIPLVAQSSEQVETPATVRVISQTLEQKLRSRKVTHPRYEILITGCSKRVYNVVGDVSYAGLLGHKDLLAEHPRKGKYLDAIKRMKPYWTAGSSYDWAEMKNGSRLGARTIKHGGGVGDTNAQGLDFSKEHRVVDESEDRPDGVDVNEY